MLGLTFHFSFRFLLGSLRKTRFFFLFHFVNKFKRNMDLQRHFDNGAYRSVCLHTYVVSWRESILLFYHPNRLKFAIFYLFLLLIFALSSISIWQTVFLRFLFLSSIYAILKQSHLEKRNRQNEWINLTWVTKKIQSISSNEISSNSVELFLVKSWEGYLDNHLIHILHMWTYIFNSFVFAL